jgi:hypothetical protein
MTARARAVDRAARSCGEKLGRAGFVCTEHTTTRPPLTPILAGLYAISDDFPTPVRRRDRAFGDGVRAGLLARSRGEGTTWP